MVHGSCLMASDVNENPTTIRYGVLILLREQFHPLLLGACCDCSLISRASEARAVVHIQLRVRRACHIYRRSSLNCKHEHSGPKSSDPRVVPLREEIANDCLKRAVDTVTRNQSKVCEKRRSLGYGPASLAKSTKASGGRWHRSRGGVLGPSPVVSPVF